jgi:hypothetical protein
MGSGAIPKRSQFSSDQDVGNAQELETSRPQAVSPPSENVDKIREILFGSHIREYERRFAGIEARLSKELTELKEESRRRLNALEGSANREIEALNARIEKERQERGESNERLNHDVIDVSNNLERKARQIEDRSIRMERELRDQILASSRAASEELRGKIEELSNSIDRRAVELRDQKVDRAALASLLNELAMRLNQEPGLPNLESLAHGGAAE